MLTTSVREVFDKYNGTLPVKFAIKHGIGEGTLRKAYERGDIERPKRGVYLLPESLEDDYLAIQSQYNRGVFSHESALNLYGYTTDNPFYYYMTFPRGYHSKQFKKSLIRPTYIDEKYYSIGLIETESWHGNKVLAYDKERTILDMLVSSHAHPYVVEEMLEEYAWEERKNLDNLYKYAELLNRQEQLKIVENFKRKEGEVFAK
ncbi:hypothetical protein M2139_001481 [Enterococcus sp. PF1-24]|uniref:type IV toxin-antitoxin system AbiEi family antitoxin domain-containing protein n=1 Tax=unclassified Enterococcus TaxID=2608891 RepID=UPI002475034E|nr:MULTISPECIES: type IV toxin-antitoxin system AbiEi family antitoxin domain-containing protein [unclassified Enterococcus]MDH6364528.1 hypothetical protein [Enterococcus sp. PFB1-1]MDH6401595.1 hypothetical protein [Enterococcus sp. PF1-24]